MTYHNQNKNDAHGAARSGAQREKLLKHSFSNIGLTLVKNQSDIAKYMGLELTKSGSVKSKDKQVISWFEEGTVKHEASGDYAESGFKYFLSDGYCPELDAIIELKGGDKNGTTEEKLFFDLMKLEDGCYGDKTLFYIFEGKKEEDKCTLLFQKRLERLQSEGRISKNVHVVLQSEMTKELLETLKNK